MSRDAFGSRCVQNLAAAGVDESLVMRHDVPTTLAVADVDEHGAARYLTSNDVAIQSFRQRAVA
ncbi:putative fructokinase [Mycobacteroides abscessus subsp. abscessus]|nr:putative fructokinase [Mycobacteroides abscessus subsp. abscessus]